MLLANSCGSPFLGWKPPPRWNLIIEELHKAGKTEFFRPVQVRKRCQGCGYAGYDHSTGYIWVNYYSPILIPDAEKQFREAVQAWIRNGIEYHNELQ